MINPFPIGGPVTGKAFWNRQDEIRELIHEIRNGQNVIISSPRRYGKTSLIKTVLEKVQRQNIFSVYVDLYPASSKEKFIKVFAKSVSNAIGSPSQKILDVVKNLFPMLIPKILLHGDGKAEFTFNFSSKEKAEIDLAELLETVHRHAKKKKRKACVVFDEFQEIAGYIDDELEREMRTSFQNHTNVCYIFMGSRKHLFNDLFQNPNRPFYKSGIHMPLQRLPLNEIEKYVKATFAKGRFELSKPVVETIAKTGGGHPYYTQLLCHVLWEIHYPKGTIKERQVEIALEKTLLREKSAYESILDGLTANQKDLLIALSEEQDAQIFSQGFMSRHELGAISSLRRAFQALVKRDLIEKGKKRIEFQDPFFAMWLKKYH